MVAVFDFEQRFQIFVKRDIRETFVKRTVIDRSVLTWIGDVILR